jgi:hypothetical protein
MKATRSLLLGLALVAAAGSASAFNFGDAAKLATQVSGGNSAQSQQGTNALSLVSAMSGLDVTPQQAVGGTGALLAVAQNQLPSNDYASLVGAVPGLEKFTGTNGLNQLSTLSNLAGALGGKSTASNQVSNSALSALGNVQTMADANQAFSALGMDSSLVSQFAPALLQYLSTQGVGGTLVQSLASVWGVAQ